MIKYFLPLFLCLVSCFGTPASGQTDMFWSFNPLNTGANNSFAEQTFAVGESGTLHLYVGVEIDTGCGLDIFTMQGGVIQFTAAESICYDIALTANPDFDLGVRWGDIFGPASQVDSDLIVNLGASNIVSGDGMVFQNNGSGPFMDLGYDIEAGAFHFAEVDFVALQPGETDIQLVPGSIGIVHNGMSLSPTIAGARIIVESDVILGDLNGDGVVTLLDVAIFIDLLATNTFQLEADINQDGALNLLDVQPFIDAINFP